MGCHEGAPSSVNMNMNGAEKGGGGGGGTLNSKTAELHCQIFGVDEKTKNKLR